MPAAPPSPPAGLEPFLQMIATYNTTFWPLQVVAYLLALLVVALAVRRTRAAGVVISAILAIFWLWVGAVFNAVYFAKVSRISVALAVVFLAEAVALLWYGVRRRRFEFRVVADARGVVGGLLVLYAMVGYPAVEVLLARGYPRSLPFGMVPCPTTIFTLGVLLWAVPRPPRVVLVLPVLYALTGVAPAARGLVEDVGLVVAGVVVGATAFLRDRAGAETLAAGYAAAESTGMPHGGTR